jgi:NAD(P)H dehydrogenase (quinone)
LHRPNIGLQPGNCANGSPEQSEHKVDTVKISIIYFSAFRGHTEKLAQAIAQGAKSLPGIDLRLIPVVSVDDHWDYIHASDAIIFGSPTYMGSVSARFKEFIERLAGDAWLQRAWVSKLAGGFTVSAGRSGDKWSTLMQLFVAASQMGMLWVSLPICGGHYSTAGSEDDLNRLAGYIGVMAQANIDQGIQQAPPSSDLRTAELYGAHIAQVAIELRAGRTALGIASREPFQGKPRSLQEMIPRP